MSKSGRALLGGFVTLGLVSSGSAIGYRSRLVSARRDEILAEQTLADRELQELNAFVKRNENEHRLKMRAADEMRTVVSTLWNDRRERYEKSVRDMESYLVAAPESIGVLHGILHHCKFLESVLPSFVRFDARSHQINSLMLGLSAARSSGIGNVAKDLVSLHSYDPFVKMIAEHAMSLACDSDTPRCMKEVSDAFAFCHVSLEKAIDSAQERLVNDRSVVPTSPSLPIQALSAAISWLKADNSKKLERSQSEIEALRRHAADLRVLTTHADARAALLFADQLIGKYQNLIVAARSEANSTPFADPGVTQAVMQFGVWRKSVLSFLLEEQAQRALDSYSLCVSDTMTQLVNEGIPETH